MIRRHPIFFFLITLSLVGSFVTLFMVRALMPSRFFVQEAYLIDSDRPPQAISSKTPVPAELQAVRIHNLSELLSKNRLWGVLSLNDPASADKLILVHRFELVNSRVFYLLLTFFFPVVCMTTFFCGLLVKAYLRRQGKIAESVLQELHRGNLKARLPKDRLIVFKDTVDEFNRMADAIAALMGKLMASEKARSEIVQELAHDIRTPLTSLQLTVDGLRQDGEKIKRSELQSELDVCGLELEYLNRLIESLVVLAQLENPDHHLVDEIDAMKILLAEVELCRSLKENKKLKWEISIPTGVSGSVIGESFLLTRAFRNLLQNATHHTKRTLKVGITNDKQFLIILIQDDGPGFSSDEIFTFGRRRTQRVIGASEASRISVGLGSVVSRKIIESLKGSLTASNWSGGGQVEIRIPLFETVAIKRAA